ncbi:PaiB family negative transcriptional regulator [Propionicimonas paludicola]|uniref:PaiB family negative transcriptional regulator n=2 Tax=Propionicimonas paludicola TaxID=185243 RepID=A0A2A9CUG3_9ACTN|nr:PaiB family negative transcriptional regulator [Propionicimonas paludicola]
MCSDLDAAHEAVVRAVEVSDGDAAANADAAIPLGPALGEGLPDVENPGGVRALEPCRTSGRGRSQSARTTGTIRVPSIVESMYTPPFNRADDVQELRRLVTHVRAGWLVTNGPVDAAPSATYLPILWQGDRVIAHLAKANPHWREISPDAPAVIIVTGPDAYVSPAWYRAKAEHGKVVPTWNYSAVHLVGTARVHHDAEWLRKAVDELTNAHERPREEPWHVSDAPSSYVEGQLRGIVGLELTVTRVEGKAKLSQNRSRADREGVVVGLRESQRPEEQSVAEEMAAVIRAERPSSLLDG